MRLTLKAHETSTWPGRGLGKEFDYERLRVAEMDIGRSAS